VVLHARCWPSLVTIPRPFLRFRCDDLDWLRPYIRPCHRWTPLFHFAASTTR
jgi:hypothetical protein